MPDITSLTWWVSVVAVGILINILASGVIRGTTKSMSFLSRLFTERSEKQKAKRLLRIQEIKVNRDLFQYFVMQVHVYMGLAISFFLLGILLVILFIHAQVGTFGVAHRMAVHFVGSICFVAACACLVRAVGFHEDVELSLKK